MKKNIPAIIIISLLLIFSSCTVSETTGRITVTNTRPKPLYDLRIGSTTIASYVPPGGSADYYYFSELNGALTINGVDTPDIWSGKKFSLKTNWMVNFYTLDSVGIILYVTIIEQDSSKEIVSTEYLK
jgi:hypothetical protein